MTSSGTIRTGIGGWTFEPWRGTFFPEGLPHSKELEYAAGKLGTIEINGTYYRTQTPATFAKWRKAVPDGFVFSVKAVRYATMKKKLAEAGESVEKFIASGLSELGDALGPVVWQMLPTRKFDAEDMGAFLSYLPATVDGLKLRHVLEVRHETFACPEFVALARKHGIAIVVADHAEHPLVADPTADFVYARLMRGQDDIPTAYDEAGLDRWAGIAKDWAAGHDPGQPLLTDPTPAKPRDVFAYIIHEGKVRAPQGAMALAERTAG
ncbi:MAG TPA: DUF72 domain-containing protein [Sphingobium sp.]|uniref:DUF72 domain-containing protein n=1 Tax=Sphingobium sp. TaxID=1912891 RepID=UPI002ED2B47A